MKAYVMTTGVLFAALAALHVYVVLERWRALPADPWPAIVLAITGAFTVWAARLIQRTLKS